MLQERVKAGASGTNTPLFMNANCNCALFSKKKEKKRKNEKKRKKIPPHTRTRFAANKAGGDRKQKSFNRKDLGNEGQELTVTIAL